MQSNGTGCPFWHWDDNYVQYLKDNYGGGDNEIVEALATCEEKKGGGDNVLEAMTTVESFGQRVMDKAVGMF